MIKLPFAKVVATGLFKEVISLIFGPSKVNSTFCGLAAGSPPL